MGATVRRTFAAAVLLVVLAVAAMLLTVAAQPGAASDEVEAERVAGANRIETSVAISQRAFPDGADRAFLARADVFADALAAGPLTGGPVLLVPSCGDVPGAVLGEIERLDPDEVVALGGQAAVCDSLLAQAAGGRDDGRIAGDSRFATALRIAQEEFGDGAEEVYVANAFDSPDAVAGGVLTRGPILLVPQAGDLPAGVAAEVDRLDPDRVIGLGGTGAVSEETLKAVADGRPTDRLAGPGRIETAAQIAAYQFGVDSEVGAVAQTVYLARADIFADAVAGGSLTDGPILLVPSCGDVPAAVAGEINRLAPASIAALGGTAAVCDDLLNNATAGAPTPDPPDEPPDDDPPDVDPPDPGDDITWVAVGDDGHIAVSDTGRAWASVDTPFVGPVNDVGHDDVGRWVAVGADGEVARSTDGWSWEAVDYPHDGDVLGVAHGDGRWVAVGRSGEVATSTDGSDWEAVDYPHSNRVTAVAHDGEDRWVAVGHDGQGATSTDGRSWTIVETADFLLEAVEHNGLDQWVSGGHSRVDNVRQSSDGQSWGPGGLVRLTVRDIAHDGEDRWLVVGDGGSVSYLDGRARSTGWDQASYPHDRTIHGVDHDGRDRWVAVGAAGQTALSNDGATWTPTNYPHDTRIHAVAATRP